MRIAKKMKIGCRQFRRYQYLELGKVADQKNEWKACNFVKAEKSVGKKKKSKNEKNKKETRLFI